MKKALAVHLGVVVTNGDNLPRRVAGAPIPELSAIALRDAGAVSILTTAPKDGSIPAASRTGATSQRRAIAPSSSATSSHRASNCNALLLITVFACFAAAVLPQPLSRRHCARCVGCRFLGAVGRWCAVCCCVLDHGDTLSQTLSRWPSAQSEQNDEVRHSALYFLRG